MAYYSELTSDDLIYLQDKPWNWKDVSQHPDFTIEWLIKFSDKEWDYEYLSEHINLPTVLCKYPHLLEKSIWNWRLICKANYSVDIDCIKAIEKTGSGKLDWGGLSSNIRFENCWIEHFPEKQWCWKTLSSKLSLSNIERFNL